MYLSVGTLVAVIGYAVRLTWKVRDIERDIQKNTDEQIDKVDAQIDNVSRDLTNHQALTADRFETMRQNTGEMGAALRGKIHEFEVFSRDHFIGKDTFAATIGRIEKMFENFGDRLERRFDKIDERFDKLDD